MPSDAKNTSQSGTILHFPNLLTFPALTRGSAKLILVFGGLFLTIVILIWFVTPYILRDYLNAKGQTLPDYHLHINWVQINPISCSVDLFDIQLAKSAEEMPVPFVKCPRIHAGLQWWEVIHGDLRSSIAMTEPLVNFVQGPTKATSQTFLDPAWVDEVKKLVPLKINQFTITNGEVHYYELEAKPKIDLFMSGIDLKVDNLTNSDGSTSSMPSTVIMTGKPFGGGLFDARLALNVDIKQPTFAEKIRIEGIPAPNLNSYLANYANVYAKTGTISFYSEMISEKGDFNGYAKPFFGKLTFQPVPQDRKTLGAIWATLVNGAKDILENDQGNIATKVPISGHYKDPSIGVWPAAFGLIKNAFLQALAKGFDHPELAPAPEKHQISSGETE